MAQWLGRWTCDWRLRVQPQPLHCRVQLWTSCSHTLSSASEVTTLWRYINQFKINKERSTKQVTHLQEHILPDPCVPVHDNSTQTKPKTSTVFIGPIFEKRTIHVNRYLKKNNYDSHFTLTKTIIPHVVNYLHPRHHIITLRAFNCSTPAGCNQGHTLTNPHNGLNSKGGYAKKWHSTTKSPNVKSQIRLHIYQMKPHSLPPEL